MLLFENFLSVCENHQQKQKKVVLGNSFTARMHGVPGEPKQRAGYLNHCKNVLIGKESFSVFAKVTLAHLSFMMHSPYTHLIH